jgi:hypothetical protein
MMVVVVSCPHKQQGLRPQVMYDEEWAGRLREHLLAYCARPDVQLDLDKVFVVVEQRHGNVVCVPLGWFHSIWNKAWYVLHTAFWHNPYFSACTLTFWFFVVIINGQTNKCCHDRQ